MLKNPPSHVWHADWGTNPKKRWVCKAVRDGQCYRAYAPTLVGDHIGFMQRVKDEVGENGTALAASVLCHETNPRNCS
jgi:hypothetical protein